METDFPEPGLQGDYSEACCVCLKGTDSGLVFAGPIRTAVVGLATLGIPIEQAAIMVCLVTINSDGDLPEGDIKIPVRVCADCVEDTPFHVGLIPFDTPVFRLDAEENV